MSQRAHRSVSSYFLTASQKKYRIFKKIFAICTGSRHHGNMGGPAMELNFSAARLPETRPRQFLLPSVRILQRDRPSPSAWLRRMSGGSRSFYGWMLAPGCWKTRANPTVAGGPPLFRECCDTFPQGFWLKLSGRMRAAPPADRARPRPGRGCPLPHSARCRPGAGRVTPARPASARGGSDAFAKSAHRRRSRESEF